ncbi:MAG: Co2+/Mg2+ efflux protein ApaG [Myxococcota bacterium]|nr:Co2+/Mg2+ efflux protein ApaG [Myxococcota bacterium]
MSRSEATTNGVSVSVEATYSPEHSAPEKSQWFFLYTITIANEGDQTVQLISRYWRITDATGELEEVRGPGVVGEQPVLSPGESFEYTSGCPLATPFGSMEGTYEIVAEDRSSFDAEVARFELREEMAIH